MKKLLLAFQFLTIVPVKVRGDVSEEEMTGSAMYFPVVGAFQGLLIALSAILLIKVLSPEITAGMVLFILILSNGGFHLDGLADTFDAMAVKSSGNTETDRQKRLSVMKDSSTGAIGTIAIAMTILLKFLLLKNVLTYSILPISLSFLFLAPVFSKWVMVPAMYHGSSARKDGLGRMFIGNISTNILLLSTLLVTLIFIAVAKIYILGAYKAGCIKLFLIFLITSYLFSFISVKFADWRFGGLTGDNLGAISELSENIFLMVVSIWLRHSF